jgi:hypothetical protein
MKLKLPAQEQQRKEQKHPALKHTERRTDTTAAGRQARLGLFRDERIWLKGQRTAPRRGQKQCSCGPRPNGTIIRSFPSIGCPRGNEEPKSMR